MADDLHRYIVLDDDGDYVRSTSIRARSSCIQWPKTLDEPIRVAFSPWHYVAQGSDMLFPIGELADESLNTCNTGKKTYDLDCRCQIVDKNGKNTVSIPPDYAALLANAPPEYAMREVTSYDFEGVTKQPPPVDLSARPESDIFADRSTLDAGPAPAGSPPK